MKAKDNFVQLEDLHSYLGISRQHMHACGHLAHSMEIGLPRTYMCLSL